jgi:hypothetical protein
MCMKAGLSDGRGLEDGVPHPVWVRWGEACKDEFDQGGAITSLSGKGVSFDLANKGTQKEVSPMGAKLRRCSRGSGLRSFAICCPRARWTISSSASWGQTNQLERRALFLGSSCFLFVGSGLPHFSSSTNLHD